tara:strand:+ start:1258 stop:1407 length:150 start_codon:yes stop_codon:yes gene_type:complete
MASTILTVFSIVLAYGFGFLSGSIAMAEKNADIHNEERKKASIHFNQIK